MKLNTQKYRWWKRGIIYQIYPRSFHDSNGDGIGDLRGILERARLSAWLGVDAIWISPIYPSPMADFGYDVADYTDIDPMFGTLADFDALVAEAHARGLKLILDFVPNHTSDQHPWFIESRSSRDKREARLVHLARSGAGRRPAEQLAEPISAAAPGSWTRRPGSTTTTPFSKSSPISTGATRKCGGAMHDVLRFWLDRGVDGFRVDVYVPSHQG